MKSADCKYANDQIWLMRHFDEVSMCFRWSNEFSHNVELQHGVTVSAIGMPRDAISHPCGIGAIRHRREYRHIQSTFETVDRGGGRMSLFGHLLAFRGQSYQLSRFLPSLCSSLGKRGRVLVYSHPLRRCTCCYVADLSRWFVAAPLRSVRDLDYSAAHSNSLSSVVGTSMDGSMKMPNDALSSPISVR